MTELVASPSRAWSCGYVGPRNTAVRLAKAKSPDLGKRRRLWTRAKSEMRCWRVGWPDAREVRNNERGRWSQSVSSCRALDRFRGALARNTRSLQPLGFRQRQEPGRQRRNSHCYERCSSARGSFIIDSHPLRPGRTTIFATLSQQDLARNERVRNDDRPIVQYPRATR